MFAIFIGLWGGLFVVWPTTYYGTSLSLDFAYSFCQVSMAGPYGLYEVGLIFIALTMWAFPTEAGYQAIGLLASADTEKIVWFAVAAVDFGINSFFTFFFSPDVKAYRDLIKAAEEAELLAE